jgi:hypothetical protein
VADELPARRVGYLPELADVPDVVDGHAGSVAGPLRRPAPATRITIRIGRHQGVPTAQTCRKQDGGLEL